MFAGGGFGYVADYVLWWVAWLSLVVHTWCFFRFFPRKRLRRRALVVGNVLVTLCLLGVVAIAAESYLRFAAVATDSFGVSLPARRWFALNTKLNSAGYRDKEWSIAKPPGVRRIAFVGDSFSYGWGITNVAERFTDRIQRRFDEAVPGAVEVMNVAKPGWGTEQELPPVRDIIARYGVDEIVLCYVSNDIESLLPVSDDFDPIRPPDAVWFNVDASCLVDFLYRRVYLPRVPSVRDYHDWLASGFADAATWRDHQIQLDAIMGACRDHGVTFRAALLPFIRTSGEKYQADRLHDTLRRFFEANNAAVVDLLGTIRAFDPDELVVNAADSHPNETAHARFAEAIWRAFYNGSRKPD
jgi:hypothetical protein